MMKIIMVIIDVMIIKTGRKHTKNIGAKARLLAKVMEMDVTTTTIIMITTIITSMTTNITTIGTANITMTRTAVAMTMTIGGRNNLNNSLLN